jgi:hypothetical protein
VGSDVKLPAFPAEYLHHHSEGCTKEAILIPALRPAMASNSVVCVLTAPPIR